MRQANPTHKLSAVLLACSAMLSACGGGGGGDTGSNSGGRLQLITFPYLGAAATLGVGTVTMNASSTSQLPVSYSSATPGVCTVSGDQLTVLTGDGECSVIANQSGGTDADGVVWGAADNISQLFVVTKTTQIAVPGTVPRFLKINGTRTLAPINNSGLPFTYVSTTQDICTVIGATATGLTVGDCLITVSQPGNDAWLAANDMVISVPTVTKIPQIISVTTPNYLAAGASTTLAATADSGLAVSYTNTTPTVCSLSGTTVTSVSQGICSISLSQAGNSDYSSATSVSTFAIAPKVYASRYVSSGPDYELVSNKLSTKSSTVEGGTVTTVAGGDWDADTSWGRNNSCWDKNWCKSTVASDGSSLTWEYAQQEHDLTHQRGQWSPSWGWSWPITAAPGKALGLEMHVGAPTVGAQTTTETTLQVKFATNTEWYQVNHLVRVQMTLGKIGSESCNIELQSDIRPASATSALWISLKNAVDPAANLPIFSISNACGQSGLTVESVLQNHPISEINFRGHDSNGDNGTNITIPSPAAGYPNGPAYLTKFTVGLITLQ